MLEPEVLNLMWDPFNLTMKSDAKVDISLWGYRETSIEPELVYIAQLGTSETNDGRLQRNQHRAR